MDVRRIISMNSIDKFTSGGSGDSGSNGGSYTINLNSQWQLSTSKDNPDSSLYEGVYESFSNYNVDSGVATMTITISGYKKFSLYIRSYAESNYDYVMVGQLDKAITGSTSYSSSDVKSHTRGNQQSGTAISNYTLVEFDNMTGGTHTITIVYRKDGSANNNDDRGYVLISKNNESYETDETNINNYLTIEALQDGLTASLSVNACEYSVDGDGNWKSLPAGTATESINTGHTLSFRGNLTPDSSNGIGTFTVNKNFNLKGNCMSMLFGDGGKDNYSLSGKNYAFYNLFRNCSTLKSVSANFLPATTLYYNCYYSMFSGCTSLTTAPELPATTLTSSCYFSMFYNCTSLTTAPAVLPATSLVYRCYFCMFDGCTSLTTAPELPATTFAEDCYRQMFYRCSNLSYIKMLTTDISATNHMQLWVKGVASRGIFVKHPDMTSLPTATSSNSYKGIPEGWTVVNDGEPIIDINNYLTIEALEDGLTASLSRKCEYCVDGDGNWKTLAADTTTESINSGHMLSFRGELNPTTSVSGIGTFTISKKCNLKGNCMSMLFGDNGKDNFSLSTKSEGSFSNLFNGCINIVEVSENFLPATTLISYCYNNMFRGCTSLTTAPTLPANECNFRAYENMFCDCTSLNYIKMLATDISDANCLYNWVKGVASTGTFVKNPAMTSLPTGTSGIPSGWTVVNDGEPIVNTDNYLTIEAIENGLTASLSNNACEYCVDGDGNWKTLSAGTATESINSGQTLSFRGNLTPNSSNGIGTFTISKKCNLKGNCMSMIFGDNAVDKYSLSGKSGAFYMLFQNCYNIINISSNFLPATTLAERCYCSMFEGCISLTTASELPATTLARSCYIDMFSGCTSLTTAPELPATTLEYRCYYDMFSGCTRLTTAPELPATTLADGCYHGMFMDCTRLTTVPELPATTLASSCYYYMFKGCTSLTTAPSLPATTLAVRCYQYMFSGCTALITAPELPATALAGYCYYGMFMDCASLTTAPSLPATTLADGCYYFMFYSCDKLNYIKMLATDISASNCLYGWVVAVASTGTFVKHIDMNSLPTGTDGIPSGWTVVNDGEESGSNLITFTIDSTEYQAEKGMTWGEWVDSEYNMGNFAHNGINFVGSRVCDVSGNQINDNTILHDGDFYSLLHNPDGDY